MPWQTCHALTRHQRKVLGDKGYRRSHKAAAASIRWVPILHVKPVDMSG